MTQLVDLPWTLKLEMTRGCNISCDFCPINTIEEYSKPKLFMKPVDCQVIMRNCAAFTSNIKIELAMRGEPTLNPYLIENLKIIRQQLPEVQITLFTNGVTIKHKPLLVDKLFLAGLNVLCLECYAKGDEEAYAEVHKQSKLSTFLTIPPYEPYRKHNGGPLMRFFCIVKDIKNKEASASTRVLNNMAGNVPNSILENKYGIAINLPLNKNCARPYRELTIMYNGNVSMCCLDWKEEVILGNAITQDIGSIWGNEKHLEYLRMLYGNERNLPLCQSCNYFGGYRHGFLRNPTTGYSYKDK